MKTRSSAAGSHALNMYCTLCTQCSQLAAAAPCMCAAEHVVRKKPGLEEEEEEEGGGGGEGGEGGRMQTVFEIQPYSAVDSAAGCNVLLLLSGKFLL